MDDHEMEEKVWKRGYIDEEGREVLDEMPLEPILEAARAPSLTELVQRCVTDANLAQALRNNDMDTFEEADDFDIPDDPIDPSSPWENDFEPSVSELIQAGNEELARKKDEESHGSQNQNAETKVDSSAAIKADLEEVFSKHFPS